MQLWFAPTSPFARKVRIAAHELGLMSDIDLVEVDPWSDRRLRQFNPLAKVPTLVLASGETLFESSVICEFLDGVGPEPRLFPTPPRRWQALLLQGLADGASTAAGRLFAEERRPAAERSAGMIARFKLAIEATLDEMERRGLDGSLPTIGEISAVAFLAYLDFRWPDWAWRAGRPALMAALAEAEHRSSFTETAFQLPRSRTHHEQSGYQQS